MDPRLWHALNAARRGYAEGGMPMATEPKTGDAYYGPGSDDAAELARVQAQTSAGAFGQPREIAPPPAHYSGDRLQEEYEDRLPLNRMVPRMATEIRNTDEGAQPYDIEGKRLDWVRRAGMVPVTRDNGEIRWTMPVLPDLLGNVAGGGTEGAGMVVGSGLQINKGKKAADAAKAAEATNPAIAASQVATGVDPVQQALQTAKSKPVVAGDAAVDAEHSMGIERQERQTVQARNIKLTPAEREVVNGLETPALQAKAATEIRRVKSRYPVSDGWMPFEATAVTFDKKTGEPVVQWKAQSYGFNRTEDDVTRVVKDAEGKPQKQPKLDKDGNVILDADGNPVLTNRNVTETNREVVTPNRGTPAYDRLVAQTARKSMKEIEDVVRRAEAGDQAAEVILRQAGWYRETMRKGFDERGGSYPGFADLLGATSPNTSVDQNYRYSVDAQRRFARGDFDDKVRFARDYDGSLNDFPKDQLIRRDNAFHPETGEAKQYGMNSRNAQMAMADRWREQVPQQAPKARNFSGNLGGQTDEATIDVWAARHINRMVGNKRLPPPVEHGVAGSLGVDLRAGGEFGFGQDVYRKLADELNKKGTLTPWLQKLGYNDVTPMDLQALTWFIEKEHWAKNNWTTKAGEGGSFEDEIRKFPTQRWQSGFSIQQAEPPADAAMATARLAVEDTLKTDDAVRVYRVHPTYGRYAGSNERSFDVELSAKPGWDPSRWMGAVIQQAKENNQYDVFFSRRLDPVEQARNPNARPGVEIYFSSRKDMDSILPTLEEFTNRGQDGFTFTTDLKLRERQAGGSDVPDYVGVRLQWVPEISMRWDDAVRAQWVKDPQALRQAGDDALNRMVDALHSLDQQKHGIVDARVHHYDTMVVGKEDYDAAIDAISRGPAGHAEASIEALHPAAWSGQPLHSHVARRDRALRAGSEGGQGPDAGGALERPDSVGKAKGGSVFGSAAYRSHLKSRLSRDGAERTVPEGRATLAAQTKDLTDGVRPAVLFPSDSRPADRPPLPKGMAVAEIPGYGTAYFNPKKLSQPELLDSARSGRLNDVLGMGPTSKAEAVARQAAGDPGRAVVLRDGATGVPKVEQATSASQAAKDAAAVKAKGRPEDSVEITSPEMAIAERMARQGFARGGRVTGPFLFLDPVQRALALARSR